MYGAALGARGGKDEANGYVHPPGKVKGKGTAKAKKLDVLALGNSAGSMKPLKRSVEK
jgi:glutamate-1-semialdehyde aminotransferase